MILWNCRSTNFCKDRARMCAQMVFFGDLTNCAHRRNSLCHGLDSRGTMQFWSRKCRSPDHVAPSCGEGQQWFRLRCEQMRIVHRTRNFPCHLGRFDRIYFYIFLDGKTLRRDCVLLSSCHRSARIRNEANCLWCPGTFLMCRFQEPVFGLFWNHGKRSIVWGCGLRWGPMLGSHYGFTALG